MSFTNRAGGALAQLKPVSLSVWLPDWLLNTCV
jgi:hypothetical protein